MGPWEANPWPGVSMIEHPALKEGLTKGVVKVVMHYRSLHYTCKIRKLVETLGKLKIIYQYGPFQKNDS